MSKVAELYSSVQEKFGACRNHKFRWSFLCRALAGIDTAIWDLYTKIKKRAVCELLGGKVTSITAYGSSMSRDISPKGRS
jgi:L-alanine-DL-glutamate epimerase-like enolase superfamily enzyme